MRRQLLPALRAFLVLSVLLGGLYPLAVLAVGQLAFHDQANGSLVKVDGRAVGSRLIGQAFTGDGYFHPRPSAAGSGYDATASGASNLGPTNPKLVGPASGPGCHLVEQTDDQGQPVLGPDGQPQMACSTDTVDGRADAYRQANGLAPGTPVPVDAVTASGSGLDPDISVANARLQAARVARARGVPVAAVLAAVRRHTGGRVLGILGEPHVNVLELNLDLDRTFR
jgi:K+-transporting ATPase ATPase C chain